MPRRGRTDAGAPSEARSKKIFSALAPEYDRFNRVSSLGLDRWWRKRTVELARVRRSDAVLDLAAGTGDLTLEIARQAHPSKILAIDLVPEMLELGKQKMAEYRGPARVDFEVMDAQALTLPDESFDVATCAFGVRNMSDRLANFREVCRVLKPGGRYVVLEFSRPTNSLARAAYNVYLERVIPVIGERITGDRTSFEYLKESIRGFPGQVALAGELHKAGFAEVTWRNLTFGAVAVHIAVK